MDKCNIFNTCGVIFVNIVCGNSVVAFVPVASGERRLRA